jgi:hypothetical protein
MDSYPFADRAAEDKRLIAQGTLFDPLTRRLLQQAEIAPGMRVLDLGSGAGDVQTLEGVEDGFDAAVGRLVLLYMADPLAALRRAATRLGPGGLICMHEADLGYPRPSRRRCCGARPTAGSWKRWRRLESNRAWPIPLHHVPRRRAARAAPAGRDHRQRRLRLRPTDDGRLGHRAGGVRFTPYCERPADGSVGYGRARRRCAGQRGGWRPRDTGPGAIPKPRPGRLSQTDVIMGVCRWGITG